jgi:hypothetical protein
VNTVTYNQTKYGPAGGGGLSYLLTPNWILSVEYLRVELYGYGGDNLAVTAGAAPGFAPGIFNANFHYDTTFIENIVRAKLDFKF